jgi:hypothetical protein
MPNELVDPTPSAEPQTGLGSQLPLALPPGAYDRHRRYSRTRATAVSFSWRAKILWSLPPIIFLAWLASGVLGELDPLAWFLGIIMVPSTIWWLRHVWTRTPLALDPSAVVPAPAKRDGRASE